MSDNEDWKLEFVYPVIKKILRLLVIEWLQFYLIQLPLIAD